MTNSVSPSLNFTRGYVVALLSAAILSTTAIFIRYLTQYFQLPALILAFWRDGIVALTVFLAMGLLRSSHLRLPRQHLPYLLGYGMVLAVFNSLWTLSVVLNGAALSTVLAYSSGGFTALLGWWLLKERLDWAKLLAVLTSLAGCALVSGVINSAAWQTNFLGILTGIGSGLLYAVYSLMGRSAAQRGLNPWTTLFYTFAFATVFLLMFNLLPWGTLPGAARQPGELFWLGDSVPGWGVLILLAAGPTLTGFGLYNVSLSYLPSSVANLILTLEPAFTATIAYFAFGEMLSGVQIGGSLLILAGVVFLRLHEGQLEKRARQICGSAAP